VALGIAVPASASVGMGATRNFHPRIGSAMGLLPPRGRQDPALATSIPVVYHGGLVMRGVTVHTLFWAPAGFRFDGSPGAGVLGYEPLIEQFFADAAHDSGSGGNLFSVLRQYADPLGAARYDISYNPATDSVDASDPFPAGAHQCSSPSGIAVCVTDLELQQELDKVIRGDAPGTRGLDNVWLVFLPPDVDTCVALAQCGTNAYAGYHALSNLGRGATVYAAVPDPLIEGTPSPGSDPEGNPEAESAIDTAAHELVEAITDPEGNAWMDPNGFEVADKCETGSQPGTPLGYAADGSPYNQLIGGHPYLVQTLWSNSAAGCVQSSISAASPLPLPTVDLTQFSSSPSGNIGTGRGGVPVAAGLVRSGNLVALALARTRAGGGWGPVSLRSARGALHAVGDDRDEILVQYGARGPTSDLIETGDGGNPFTESGWTGWFDLDNGYAVSTGAGGGTVLVGPCFQAGVLGLTVAGAPTPPPGEQCGTESAAAVVHTRPLGAGTELRLTSEDNRAVWAASPNGALVKLTIGLGEPGSVSALGNGQLSFSPSGFPQCTAYLRLQAAGCTGLVPGGMYTLTRRRGHAVARARANGAGAIAGVGFRGRHALRGGDVLTLVNRAHRTLSTLHVAHLRVDITGEQTRIASGTCQPGDYYGPPPATPPVSVATGVPGLGGTGTVCPPDGRAGGLSSTDIAQTDEFSGGLTQTSVPDIVSTSPIQDETLYGPFIASAQTGVPGPNGSIVATGVAVALTVTRAASRRTVFHATNVDSAQGVAVPALAPGAYVAKWVLTDAAGDTRTVRTRFADEP
jgi:hypothetical protein